MLLTKVISFFLIFGEDCKSITPILCQIWQEFSGYLLS